MVSGVEILEYMPSHLHGKVAVMDGVATVGSSNLDPFSLLLAREANVVVHDKVFVQQLRQSLEHAIQKGSVVIEPGSHKKRHLIVRSMDALAYLVVRVGVAITGHSQEY